MPPHNSVPPAGAGWLVSTVHEDPSVKLTALAAWGDDVAIGTSDGMLLRLAPPAQASAGEAPASTAMTLQGRVRVAAEHAIVQVCAASPCGVLVLLLADGTVTTHELPSLKPLERLERGVDCTSIAMLHADNADGFRLAAAGRKKLVLYRWQAATAAVAGGAGKQLFDAEAACFVPLAEVALQEPIRWMAWGGERQLWLALRGRYARLALPALEMTEVLRIPGGAKHTEPLGASLDGGEVLLLSQETLGVFLDNVGRPSRGFSLTLSEAPLALATATPFLVALHKRGAEVHTLLHARPPVQRLPQLAGAIALASACTAPQPPALRPPAVFVLSAHSVERLTPPTLPAHAQSLALSGEIDEALALSEVYILPPLNAATQHESALVHLSRLVQAHTLATQQRKATEAAEAVAAAAAEAAEAAADRERKERKESEHKPGHLVKELGHVVKELGRDVKDHVKELGRDVKELGRDIGHHVKELGRDIKDHVKELGRDIKDLVRSHDEEKRGHRRTLSNRGSSSSAHDGAGADVDASGAPNMARESEDSESAELSAPLPRSVDLMISYLRQLDGTSPEDRALLRKYARVAARTPRSTSEHFCWLLMTSVIAAADLCDCCC